LNLLVPTAGLEPATP